MGMVVRLSLQVSSAGVMDVHWLTTQEFMHVQLISWTGSKLKWEATEQHPHQLQQHPHQLDVDLPNGPLTNGVMMKTTTLIATGTAALAVTMTLEDGTHIAQPANALNHQLQPLQLQQPPQQPQQPPPLQLPLVLHLDVDPHNGLKINGVMMKIITLIATGMVALVVTMLLEDGTHTAQIVNALIPMLKPLPLLRLLALTFILRGNVKKGRIRENAAKTGLKRSAPRLVKNVEVKTFFPFRKRTEF